MGHVTLHLVVLVADWLVLQVHLLTTPLNKENLVIAFISTRVHYYRIYSPISRSAYKSEGFL